ncbi:MAG: helix-hairpin-helix domain-containing protein, partial [Holophagaceae bacterium]
RELKNEKIDIVRYSDDSAQFIANALNPAKAIRVNLIDPEARRVEVVVDDEQLSVAIGKRGQNVRLAAKLTGWNIDVRSETDKRREAELAMGLALPTAAPVAEVEVPETPASTLLETLQVEGLDAAVAERLASAGYPDAKSLYTVTAEQLMQAGGMDQDLAFRLIDAVQAHFGE